MVTVKYSLSQAGQKQNLLAGGNGKPQQELIVKKGDLGYEDAITECTVGYNGYAEIDAIKYSNGNPKYLTAWDTIPSLQQILDDVHALNSRIETERITEHEQKVQACLTEGPSWFLFNDHSGFNQKLDDPRVADVYAQAEVLVSQYKLKRQEKELADQEAIIAKENRLKEQNAALKRWATEHGSELLKARIDGGFKWVDLAHTEYANTVVQGFELARDGDCDKAECRETPTLREIQFFNAVKLATDGLATCDLRRRKYDVSDSEFDSEYVWETEIDVNVECPDGFIKTVYLKCPAGPSDE